MSKEQSGADIDREANTDGGSSTANEKKRTRTVRPYPAGPFEDAMGLGVAIQDLASGQRVKRLTLLEQLQKAPTSEATRQWITNSSKYGITTGSFNSEWLALTETGALATDRTAPIRDQRHAQFTLAIEGVAPFERLYSANKGRKVPSHAVMRDALAEAGFMVDNPTECVDTFIVNCSFLGLLRTIGGSETLVPIDVVLDSLAQSVTETTGVETTIATQIINNAVPAVPAHRTPGAKPDWDTTCFVITPIGEDGSEQRAHADLFLDSLIEPALRELGFDVVRADRIGAGGMITTQIIEYVVRSRLAIADLSFHNPNAFYEMAIRHTCGLPMVQISRKQDRLPFDVNQVRTVVIDTTSIYSLVPKLETYRSEIATQARAALASTSPASNPISVFFPGLQVSIPKT